MTFAEFLKRFDARTQCLLCELHVRPLLDERIVLMQVRLFERGFFSNN